MAKVRVTFTIVVEYDEATIGDTSKADGRELEIIADMAWNAYEEGESDGIIATRIERVENDVVTNAVDM